MQILPDEIVGNITEKQLNGDITLPQLKHTWLGMKEGISTRCDEIRTLQIDADLHAPQGDVRISQGLTGFIHS